MSKHSDAPQENPLYSLERDFLILCTIILIILCAFSGIIAWQTNHRQNEIAETELKVALQNAQESFDMLLTQVVDFTQYIGNEVLNTYNGTPGSAIHLFKHEFSTDIKVDNFYSWVQLSWLNDTDTIAIAPTGIIQNGKEPSEQYPIVLAKKRPWALHIGDISTRNNYTYLPVAMGVQSDENAYVGTIISDLIVEQLYRDIYKTLGKKNHKYRFIIWDDKLNAITDSRPAQGMPIEVSTLQKKLRSVDVSSPSYTRDRKAIISKIIWENRHFYLMVTHDTQITDYDVFWKEFLPYIYLAGTLTLAFLVLIYFFRKRTILPVLNKLKINLAEEIAARQEKDRFLNQILSGINGFLYRHKMQEDTIKAEFVSEGCAQLTGYDSSMYFGENRITHSDVIHPDYQHQVSKHIKECLRQGKAFELSYPIITAKESIKWVLNQGHPIANSPNTFEGLLTDITDIKNTEQKMQETLKALKISNMELEEFAYACSHDLKEPLRTIYSYIQLYKKEEQQEYLGYIEDSTLRMKHMIENILLYSQLGITAQVKKEVTSLNNAVDAVQESMQGAIIDSQGKIEVQPMGDVMVDKEQLHRLLQNILANALKFKGQMPPSVQISGAYNNDMWTICIKDNGIGIAAEFQKRVFNLFQRLHSQDKFQGSGIGLNICKKIVERHGGEIWIESELGQGTSVFFTLPAPT